jgi:hypothetical protein
VRTRLAALAVLAAADTLMLAGVIPAGVPVVLTVAAAGHVLLRGGGGEGAAVAAGNCPLWQRRTPGRLR